MSTKTQMYSELAEKASKELTHDGKTQVDVRFDEETVWLTANQMALLFDRDEKNIRKHINNIFADGELIKENNTQKMRVDVSRRKENRSVSPAETHAGFIP